MEQVLQLGFSVRTKEWPLNTSHSRRRQVGPIPATKQSTSLRRKKPLVTASLLLYDNVIICHNNRVSASRTRASRVFTISFPEELAKQVVAVAEEENRNLSELFREAFRTYRVERVQRKLMAMRRIKAERTSMQDPEDEIEPVAARTRDE